MTFEDAVTLAREINAAGCRVEALSCREDGRLGPWRVYFLGPAFSSNGNVVSSREDWITWARTIKGSRPWPPVRDTGGTERGEGPHG